MLEDNIVDYTPHITILENSIHILKEDTFDIDEDVDLIYKTLNIGESLDYYKKFPSDFWEEFTQMKSENWDKIKYVMDSSELVSPISREAHKANPIKIKFLFDGGSKYRTDKPNLDISMNGSAIKALGRKGLGNANIVEQYPQIVEEFNENRLKGIIAHELTHWIGESLYNKKASRAIQSYGTKKHNKDGLGTERLQITSEEELSSFIAQIKQRKRFYKDEEWNQLSFSDLLSEDPSLNYAFEKSSTRLQKSDYIKFTQDLIKRMHREDLLGNKMRTPRSDFKSKV